jgi:hypothetical protein
VTVVTPAPGGSIEADGAFDVIGVGTSEGRWPTPTATTWAQPPDFDAVWIVDEPSADALALLSAFGNATTAFSITQQSPSVLRELPLTPASVTPTRDVVGMHVPINPLAAAHRHIGLGFTGYVLALTDRPATPPVAPPTNAVAWLTSRFYDQYVVVLEGGRAAVWKGRALRGVIGVDTRVDLWRLMAHANVTVDLAPGEIIARECVESLRLATPIAAPDGSVGADHARAGGGFVFGEMADLLESVDRLADREVRDELAERARTYADLRYGACSGFTERIARLIASAT